MAYSRVERRIWNDERFRQWPREKREAWLYLLTGPHQNRLGCFVMDPRYLAADIQIETGRAEAILGELETDGRLLWERSVRLVLLTQHLKHNRLENPNVAKAAAEDLTELPRSDRILSALLSALDEFGTPETERGEPFYAIVSAAIRTRLSERAAIPDNSLPDEEINGSANSSDNGYPKQYRNPDPEPDPEPDPDPLWVGAAAARAREDEASKAVMAANRGMRDNPAIGDRFNPIPSCHASRTEVLAWLDAGVPSPVIESTVYETARSYRPSGRRRQISSMGYFTSAVLEEHERERIAADARGAPGPPRGEAGKPAEVQPRRDWVYER